MSVNKLNRLSILVNGIALKFCYAQLEFSVVLLTEKESNSWLKRVEFNLFSSDLNPARNKVVNVRNISFSKGLKYLFYLYYH